jgi:hypothetical protein
LLTLCSLLNDSPLLNEPGQTIASKDYMSYQKSIEFANIDFAICGLLDKSVNRVPEQFIHFYPSMKELFFKNYDKVLDIVEKKAGLNETCYVYIYQMTTQVDYALLKNKLVAVKDYLK